MSMNNKQRWMGGVVLLGGGVLLAALLLKGKEEIHQKQAQTQPVESVQQRGETEGQPVQLQPLTVDVETEKRLLEEQRRAREKAVAEQESKTAEFLRMQQEAEAAAARKAAEEYAALNAKRNAAQNADIPPELVEDDQAKAKRQAEEQKKADQQKAEQKKATEAAEQKRKLEEQKKAEAAKKAAEQKLAADKKVAEDKAKADAAKKAELAKKEAEQKKRQAEEVKKKAEAEKARQLLEGGEKQQDKQWMVQVALAANEANADAVAAKLRAKGYKVTKSPTSKGIRIMVGPAKDRDSADATRKKINSDPSLDMKSAWVIDWVPLEKRQ